MHCIAIAIKCIVNKISILGVPFQNPFYALNNNKYIADFYILFDCTFIIDEHSYFQENYVGILCFLPKQGW